MNELVWLIIGCEIAFWVMIVLGLVTRYVCKLEKLGLFFLALTPVIDLILLLTTSIDLYQGATATTPHAIAAIYIGVSLVYGKSMIQWADERFQYYVLKQGRQPVKKLGMEYAKSNGKNFVRHVCAYVIGVGLLVGIIFFINDPERTEAMNGVIKLWSLVVVIDLIITISYFIFPKKQKSQNRDNRSM